MSNAPDYGALYEKPGAHGTVDPSRFPRDGAYIQVPQALAEKHPLYGIAGWTIVLAVFMILDSVVYALFILGAFILAADVTPGARAFVLLAFVNIGLLAWAIATIVKLFQKHPSFPRQLTMLSIASMALTVIGMLIAGANWIGVIQLVVAGVYIAYVQASRRVRVTYRHQIEATDPLFDYLPRENVVSGSSPAMPAA